MSFVTGPLPQRLKIIHGFGAVAFGVKDSGFSFFLLIFYNQVLGMDAGMVSLALAAALVVDAFVDPRPARSPRSACCPKSRRITTSAPRCSAIAICSAGWAGW